MRKQRNLLLCLLTIVCWVLTGGLATGAALPTPTPAVNLPPLIPPTPSRTEVDQPPLSAAPTPTPWYTPPPTSVFAPQPDPPGTSWTDYFTTPTSWFFLIPVGVPIVIGVISKLFEEK